MLVFEKCDNSTSLIPCKSEAEIKEWMTFKYILTIVNQAKFVQHKFDSERVDRAASTHWQALSPDDRMDYVFEVSRSSIDFNDNYFNVGGLMTEEDEGFFVTRKPNRQMPYKNSFKNAVTFEMSLD